MERFRLSIKQSDGTWFGCLIDDRDRLTASTFGPSSKKVETHLTSFSKKTIGRNPIQANHEATRRMIDLYNGTNLSEPLEFNENYVTPFELQVVRILNRIPAGKVTTYGMIAKSLHSAPRAVGGAVGSNPWPLFVPCHRVVNWDMTVGNYSMCGSLKAAGTITKQGLLGREGVPIKEDRINKSALWTPSGNPD